MFVTFVITGCYYLKKDLNLKLTGENTMTKPTHTKEAIRAAMDHLIDRATNFDIEALETIYHKDFHTTLVMPDSTVVTYNKEEFKAHFAKQAEEGKTQLNTWADWHDFHVLGDSAVCVLTRRHSGMNDEEMKLLCNIELRFEDGRWQVIREAIFLRPLSEA
jgi:ketosteroid isomerase-like protein